jgi:hypothetical protein
LRFPEDDAIVVESRGRQKDVPMERQRVPEALQQRLGPEGTAGLLHLLADVRKECVTDVITVVGDRFERRLVEETSTLRLEMSQGFAALRQEMAASTADLRQEMAAATAGLRQEMAAATASLRQEMAAATAGLRQEMAAATAGLRHDMATGTAGLRQEMADQKFDILKWAFLFWVGQFFAVASLMAVLIRVLRS